MNKTELVAAVAEKTGLTKKDADRAVNAAFEAITESMVKGDKVQIPGFGTFEAKLRAARTGINPITKAKVEIPETKAPAFKAFKTLKDRLN